MIRVIMGKKGTGKTKQMIDMINEAVQSEHGNVVCIEKGSKLTFDIHYQIRLVDSSEYDVANFTALKGFISGLHAGNYDITHIFIDSLTKIVPTDGYNDVEDFLNWLNNFGEKEERHQVHHHHQRRARPGPRGHQAVFLIPVKRKRPPLHRGGRFYLSRFWDCIRIFPPHPLDICGDGGYHCAMNSNMCSIMWARFAQSEPPNSRRRSDFSTGRGKFVDCRAGAPA